MFHNIWKRNNDKWDLSDRIVLENIVLNKIWPLNGICMSKRTLKCNTTYANKIMLDNFSSFLS